MKPGITLVGQWMENDGISVPTREYPGVIKKIYSISSEFDNVEYNVLLLTDNASDVHKIHLDETRDIYYDFLV